ncbi:hypothetical protein [Streptomyces sp. HUAS ZL42]|uniref:hypothetical protein n=1 Tax=Streptomyces sp. HUAS ZL42 TaxID=3231715 RepID=UPI00345E2118
MALTRDVTTGRTRWGVVAAILALPALGVIGFAVLIAAWIFSDDPFGAEPKPVPCAEALHYGGAALPAGAQTVGCTEQGFQDTEYSATFRMPRADVGSWLSGTYPDAPAPGTAYCADEDADLCLALDATKGLPDGVSADAVRMSVVYEDADTALVRFSAFTM